MLLGSIASPKYVDVLHRDLRRSAPFPVDFVGRGDMSRGGLLLRQASDGVELDYVPVAGAVLHGAAAAEARRRSEPDRSAGFQPRDGAPDSPAVGPRPV